MYAPGLMYRDPQISICSTLRLEPASTHAILPAKFQCRHQLNYRMTYNSRLPWVPAQITHKFILWLPELVTKAHGSLPQQGFIDCFIYRTGGNFRQEKFFANFTTCSHWRSFLSTKFFSCVNDYIEDMVTFTALAKIYSIEYFCNTKVTGLGEIFVQRIFHLYGILLWQHNKLSMAFMPYSIPTLTVTYQDFRWSYTSGWCCRCPTPLVKYKEHSSARHFQQKLPETS